MNDNWQRQEFWQFNESKYREFVGEPPKTLKTRIKEVIKSITKINKHEKSKKHNP